MADRKDTPREPCTSCGRETAAGSRNFSGRRAFPGNGGERDALQYLCGPCQEEIHRAHKVARLSDAELRRLVEEGRIPGKVYHGAGSLRRL